MPIIQEGNRVLACPCERTDCERYFVMEMKQAQERIADLSTPEPWAPCDLCQFWGGIDLFHKKGGKK